jgi:hypothetical protein
MISLELRDKLLQYINAETTLEQLEDWVVPRLPAFLKEPSSTDADIISAIELGLAEISDDIRTEDELRAYLNEALQEVNVLFQVSDGLKIQTTSGSSNQTNNLQYSTASFEYSVVII